MTKIALQIMIDDLKQKRYIYENAGMKESVISLESSIILATELLKLEKEQMINFAHECSVSYRHEIERKYNEKFRENNGKAMDN